MKPNALALLALALAAADADAATWTGSDGFALAGFSATHSVSFTGDGITSGAQVDVAVPSGFGILSATGRNGAMCVRQSGTNTVRVVVFNVSGSPLPSVPLNHCDIRLAVPVRPGGYNFPMRNAVCADAVGSSVPCTLDPGWIYVISRF